MATGAVPGPIPGSCPGCGAPLDASSKFCNRCGRASDVLVVSPSKRMPLWVKVLIGAGILMVLAPVGLFFAVPKLLSSVQSSHETAAIVAIKTIQTEQLGYQSTYGRFATSLTQLGPPGVGGIAGPEASGLIAARLSGGHVGGYFFTITATPTGYAVLAVPQNGAGRRNFYADESGIIRENWGSEPATAASPEIGTSSHP